MSNEVLDITPFAVVSSLYTQVKHTTSIYGLSHGSQELSYCCDKR